ncbi:aldose 1-epimerase [Chloroflexota bacterium]
MFKIRTDHLGSLLRFVLANPETGEYVSIIPGFGGNVNRIVLRKMDKNYAILDGARTDSELIKNAWFKGAKLIPFPNRICNGQYSFAGKPYQLPINLGNHAIHGFIYDKVLKVTDKTINDNQVCLELEYLYDASLKGYPFNFQATLTYSLIRDKGFQYKTEITNLGNCSLPVGDGWHPYFKTKGKVDRLHIKIPAESRTEVNAQMIPTGKRIHENYDDSFQIGNKQFDTGFVLKKAGGKAITELYDPDLDLKICLWQETGKWKYNYLQVFIPPSRGSIAIEPMTCTTDAYNNRIGLIILEPRQSFAANCGVRLE